MCNWVRVRVTRSSWTLLSVLTKWHLSSLCLHNHMSFFIPAEAQPKSLHSIFINVTSQWPVTPLLLIAFSIVPFAETPTMWVSSIFGNQGGLAPARESRPVAVLCCTIMLENKSALRPNCLQSLSIDHATHPTQPLAWAPRHKVMVTNMRRCLPV